MLSCLLLVTACVSLSNTLSIAKFRSTSLDESESPFRLPRLVRRSVSEEVNICVEIYYLVLGAVGPSVGAGAKALSDADRARLRGYLSDMTGGKEFNNEAEFRERLVKQMDLESKWFPNHIPEIYEDAQMQALRYLEDSRDGLNSRLGFKKVKAALEQDHELKAAKLGSMMEQMMVRKEELSEAANGILEITGLSIPEYTKLFQTLTVKVRAAVIWLEELKQDLDTLNYFSPASRIAEYIKAWKAILHVTYLFDEETMTGLSDYEMMKEQDLDESTFRKELLESILELARAEEKIPVAFVARISELNIQAEQEVKDMKELETPPQ